MADWDCIKDEEDRLTKEEGYDRDQAGEIAVDT
jgi:hypothetical protein